MPDFHQNGVIATLHNFNTKKIEEIEKDLLSFSKTSPMTLILPSLYSELEKPALTYIVNTLKKVKYIKNVVIGLDQANKNEFLKAKKFFSVLPQKTYILWNDGPRLKKIDQVEVKERKKPKYTPLSKRQDRPDAILWLCKNASELTDGQISKLVGSTKGTVSLIRKRSYWNFSNLKPRDPVILALCSQDAFQKSLEKAKRRVEREKKAKIRAEKKASASSLGIDK